MTVFQSQLISLTAVEVEVIRQIPAVILGVVTIILAVKSRRNVYQQVLYAKQLELVTRLSKKLNRALTIFVNTTAQGHSEQERQEYRQSLIDQLRDIDALLIEATCVFPESEIKAVEDLVSQIWDKITRLEPEDWASSYEGVRELLNSWRTRFGVDRLTADRWKLLGRRDVDQ